MSYKENLTEKHISEFNSDDTIYIPHGDSSFSTLMLCQFIKHEKGVIHGKVLEATTNPKLYDHDINQGWEIKSKADRCKLYGTGEGESRSYFRDILPSGHFYVKSGKVQEGLCIPNHDSYGMVTVYKSQSSQNRALYGSSIKHSETITLAISKGSLDREFGEDRYRQDGKLIEIEMSKNQFSDIITSMNYGDGNPCTITWMQGRGKVEEPPFVSRVEQFSGEFKNKLHNMTSDSKSKFDQVKAVLEKKSINKGDREFLLNAMTSVFTNVENNVPFIQEQFAKQMDRVVTEAKTEIEGFLSKRADDMGIKLEGRDVNKMLGQGDDTEQ